MLFRSYTRYTPLKFSTHLDRFHLPMATSTPNLSATYTSPTNPAFTHIAELPALGENDLAKRVTYLSALRSEAAKLQERINTELTQRMEEDKAKAENDASPRANKRKVDDVAEEENYGEEVVEED